MVNDDEERRGDRRSLFLIDGHHIISGWPGWFLGLTTRKGEERNLWRYDHCNAKIPWNSETLCGHTENTRRVFGVHVFPRRHQLAFAGLVTLRNELFRGFLAALSDMLSSHTFVLPRSPSQHPSYYMSLLELNRCAKPFGGYADYQVTPMPIYACEAHKYTLLCVRLPYGRELAALSIQMYTGTDFMWEI